MNTSLIIILFLFCLSSFVMGEENKKLTLSQQFGIFLENEEWAKAKLVLQRADANADIQKSELNFYWGLWYSDKANPEYDKNRSTRFFEVATELGSREAQLILIGVYLFSEDSESVNYMTGVSLGKDQLGFYLNQINENKDLDGEIHRNVGKFYLFGIGVEKNPDEGVKYIKKAAALGDAEAKEMLIKSTNSRSE